MAIRNQSISIYDLQREVMATELQATRASTAQALAGKTGPRGGSRDKFITRARPNREIDVHEVLKRDAFAPESDMCKQHFEKNRPCPNSVYGVSDQYLILDSFEKVETSRPDLGELQFNFMVQGVTRNQNIGVKDELNTIIEMQVSEFDVPVLPLDDFTGASLLLASPGLSVLGLAANGPLPTGDAVTSPMSQIPFGGRVTMYLKEIGLQSFSDADNRRHHFEFISELDGDRLKLRPLRGGESFIFTDPIKDIHGVTLCFYNPGTLLRFPPDCIFNARASADAGQLLQFTFTDPTNLINLAVGDRIFIRRFSTGNSLLDAYVARNEGHLVGAGGWFVSAPTPSGTSVRIRLNPDVSVAAYYAANAPITSTSAISIRIAKNRIRVPMRFRRVIGRLTNYIAP